MSFDRVSFFYEFIERYILKEYQVSLELFDKYFNPQPGSNAIDIGGGIGLFSQTIIDKLGNIVNVDPSFKMLRKNTNSDIVIIQGDGSCLSFKNDIFDIAIIINVLHHIPSKYQKKVITEAYRVLKKQGKIFILEVFPKALINEFFGIFERIAVGNVCYITDDKLKSFLIDVGFKKIDISIPKNHSWRYVIVASK